MDRTGAALREPAAEMRVIEPELVAQYVKERRVGCDLDGAGHPVQLEGNTLCHFRSPHVPSDEVNIGDRHQRHPTVRIPLPSRQMRVKIDCKYLKENVSLHCRTFFSLRFRCGKNFGSDFSYLDRVRHPLNRGAE